MKKNTSQKLSKRLSQYGALSVAIAGISGLNAQERIYYNDIADEVVPAGGNYAIDINNDSIGDLLFLVNSVGSGAMVFPISSISASVYNANAIAGASASGFNYPFNLSSGNPINSTNGTFNDARGDLYWGPCYPNSQFCAQEGFLGVHINIPAGLGFDTYYGWVRIEVGADHTITIKDYASHLDVDTSINAGQTTTLGVEDNVFTKIKVIALSKSIGLYNIPETTKYNVFSMTGQQVLNGTTNSRDYVIEAPTLASGVYIVELADTNSNGVIRKKVVLQ